METNTWYKKPSDMLPIDLKIEDYSTNEKIGYLPRKLTQVTDTPFDNERPGDIAYYAPWAIWSSSTTATDIRKGLSASGASMKALSLF